MDSPTFSGTKTSDTVIDLKAATGDETTDSSRKSSETKESVADGNVPYSAEAGEKKSKPPPLDVSAAQELDQSQGGPRTPTSALPNMMLDRRKSKERKIGHRRVNQEGEITFKKIQTSQIMGSIQLGIGNAVGSLASKPERDLLMQDFTIVETTNFPKDGGNITPAHHYSEFRFKSYAPVAFRYFRDLFGIQPDDFLLSLCNFPLIELTNPGASGSIFYLTEDDEFIIKTVSHTESEFLMKLLPGYYMNLNQNPRTLLPKFFGLYCYQCGGKNVRLVVMNNLLPSFVQLHEKYDLKGSTYKRKASKHERKKKSPTYKDLDFMERHPDGIILEADTYNSLIKTITRDCRVLESFRIMDFSLLVGIYNLDQAKREKQEQRRREDEASTEKVSDDSESASPTQVGSGKGTSLVRSKSINRQRLAAFSTAMESIQAEIEMPEEDEDVPTGGIPAKNVKGENLLLFLGVIDILQSFCLRKKLEHTLKSVLHDGDTVSVHRPGFYAHRFMDFMSKTVFRKAPSTGQHRKFKTMVTSVLALKHSPSKKKAISNKKVDADVSKPFLSKISSEDDDSVAEAGSCGTSGCSSSHKVCDPIPARMGHSRSTKTPTVTWDKGEVISLSQVTITTESTGDCVSETSSSSGFSSTLQTVTWTPPLSVEGSTPTHTEGTPSFTESSSSGDAACPTTPVKCIPKSAPLGETQVLPDSEVGVRKNLSWIYNLLKNP